MQAATFQRVLEGARAEETVGTVSFWGIGEPLLHPGIGGMVAAAHELGARTELITNGHLLDDARCRELVDAGLDRLVVSLDGPTPAALSRMRPGADLAGLERSLRALQLAVRRSPGREVELALESVLTRSNLAELPAIVERAREQGAATLYVTNLLPYTEKLKDEILYWLCVESAAFALRVAPPPGLVLPRIDARPEIQEVFERLGVRPARPSLRDLFAVPTAPGENRCPFVDRGTATVGWDGTVSPCPELLHTHTVYVLGREKRVMRYAAGHLADRPLPAIWRDPGFEALRERIDRFDFSPCVSCGGCELAETNEEDCVGSPFPACGDCLWARGVILCP